MLEKIPYNDAMVDRSKVSFVSEFRNKSRGPVPYYTFWQSILKIFGFRIEPKMIPTSSYARQAHIIIDGDRFIINHHSDEKAREIYDWFIEGNVKDEQ